MAVDDSRYTRRARAGVAPRRAVGHAVIPEAAAAPDPAHARSVEELTREVERLSQANATLSRILGAIEEYVYTGEFLADGSYVLRFAGPCRERFLGLSADEARTAVWVDFVHPDDLEVFDEAHELAKRTQPLDIQYRLLGADGRLRWVRDRGRVHRVGDRLFLDGSVLDVTALREAEQRLTEHVHDIEVLAAAHLEMALIADPAAAREAICRAVRKVCSATAVGLFQVDGADLLLVEQDGIDRAEPALSTAGSSGAARAFRSGDRVLETGAVGLLQAEDPGGSRVLFEPVLRGGRRLGVVAVIWDGHPDPLPVRVQALLPLLMTEVAVVLERAELVDRLSTAAHTDPLTGLLNRRALEDLLPLEMQRATQSHSSLCVAMLDVDRFKAYNDDHGHPVGDLLLREASRRWQSILRSSDALVRFGGEEFLAVLPDCELSDARELLERLRAVTPFEQTCSIGVARWDGTEGVAALLHRADQTMYAAKRAGRNQVRSAG